MKVEINGVPYVPATDASPDMEKIARGLASMFWGDTCEYPLEKLLDGITVNVNDNGEGYPIKEVLAAIAEHLGLPEGKSDGR